MINWYQHVEMNQAPGSTYAASKKETEKEIVNFEREWDNKVNPNSDEKDQDFFDLLAWSKFRYVLVRRIFDLDVGGDYYILRLNSKEIRFDYESAMHILSRHFGHGMKTYVSVKDHFYGVFRHDQLHRDFERIFSQIDESGLFAQENVTDISFRFKGEIYKIWSLPIDASGQIFRISTFFPVSSPRILDKLRFEYTEKTINDELSIFIK